MALTQTTSVLKGCSTGAKMVSTVAASPLSRGELYVIAQQNGEQHTDKQLFFSLADEGWLQREHA